MANLLEVLVTCDTNNSLWSSCIWDPHTGASLMTYKGGGTLENRSLNIIGKDYIAAVEKSKPVLHIWPLNSQQTVHGLRFILPGKASAFAISNNHAYCAAGIDEKLYVWQLASGNLLTILNRHYQKVIQLKFTEDGSHFVSAGEDGMVMVWSLAAITAHPEVELVTQKTAGQHDPVYIFSDHTLPITDLVLSKTGMNGRLCTVSADRTCKIYDLSTSDMLLNVVFECPLTSVTFDVLELNVFVGNSDGNIFQFSLTNPPRSRDLLINSGDEKIIFSGHSKSVTCLSVSQSGEILMSGSSDEQIILWHIKSRQPVRTIKHKGAITNAFFIRNIASIYKQEFKPSLVLHSLERTLEKDNDEINELEVLTTKENNFWPIEKFISNIDIPNKQLENDYKQKEAAMKDEIEKLKKINASLYSFGVEKALNSKYESNFLTSAKRKKNKNK